MRRSKNSAIDKQWLEDQVERIPESGCWLWTGSITDDGYGRIRVKSGVVSIHRSSYQLYKGKIPDGLCVCHTCDIPSCFNPDHLYLGTHQDNMDDRTARGRGFIPAGEANGSAKLTDADVIAIRKAVGNQQEIGNEFGVSNQLVSAIKLRRVWKHL